MTNHTQVSEPDEEMSLIDLLVVVAENIKLLLLGPLLAGLLVFIGSSMLPTPVQTNTPQVATFVINGQRLFNSQQLVSMVSAESTHEQATKLLESTGQAHAAQSLKLENIKIASPKDSILVSVSVSASHEAEALAIADALLKATLAASRPLGTLLTINTQAQEIDQSLLTNALHLEKKLLNQFLNRTLVEPDIAQAYNDLVRTIAETADRIERRQLVLDGLNEMDVVNRPRVLPIKATPIQSQTVKFSFLAILAMSFVLFLFVVVRQAIRKASGNPEAAAKLERIRQALGLRKNVI